MHGGELIDQSHTSIRHLAQELGLSLDKCPRVRMKRELDACIHRALPHFVQMARENLRVALSTATRVDIRMTQQAAQLLQETVTPVLGDQAERFKDAFNAHSNVMMPDAPQQGLAQQPMAPPQHMAPPQQMAPPPVSRPAPGNRPRPAPVADDDDFGGNSILR